MTTGLIIFSIVKTVRPPKKCNRILLKKICVKQNFKNFLQGLNKLDLIRDVGSIY